MNLDMFFKAKRIAIIGASKEEGKIGNVIFKNMMIQDFKGDIFPVNPNSEEVLGYKCYDSIRDISGKVDLAVICVPAKIVPKVLKECGKKKTRHVVIISAGFKETGNKKLDSEMMKMLEKYKIKCIGPNCLGIYDSTSLVDTLFLPKERLKRPKKGGISFVSQSGASGSAILDLAAEEGFGFAKFISYGNAANIDESDLIEYLGNDNETEVICFYVEGILNGKRFMDVVSKIKKPVIVIKGGVTSAGSKATMSHTGSLAGEAEIYFGAFKQSGMIIANTLEEMFDYLKIFEKIKVKPKGKKIQVITNGGGFGILCADAIEKHGLDIAEMSSASIRALKKKFPSIVIVKNPMDLLGDADTERYKIALQQCIKDKKVDIILAVVLAQTPLMGEGNIVEMLDELNKKNKKPIITVNTGSEYAQNIKKSIEEKGIPCFVFPNNAVRAVKAFVEYYNK